MGGLIRGAFFLGLEMTVLIKRFSRDAAIRQMA